MINSIPTRIADRMQYLERLDTADREDGTERLKRLRQIPPETGQFISLMLMLAPKNAVIEIGTSAGYSTLWLALACRNRDMKITTYEILPEKSKLAAETFNLTKTDDIVTLIDGDARNYLEAHKEIGFCFLDAEKEVYQDCYDLVIPRLVAGGILVADNAINHADTLQPMIDFALSDKRIDGMVIPVGKGLLLCRKH